MEQFASGCSVLFLLMGPITKLVSGGDGDDADDADGRAGAGRVGPGRAGGLGGAGCGQVGLGAKHFDLDFGVLVCVACGGRGLR